jgi:hypothetical protein
MRQDRRMHDGKNIVPTDHAGHEDEVSTGPDPFGITLRSRPSGWLQDGMGRKATGGLRELRGGHEGTDPFVTRYAGIFGARDRDVLDFGQARPFDTHHAKPRIGLSDGGWPTSWWTSLRHVRAWLLHITTRDGGGAALDFRCISRELRTLASSSRLRGRI